MRDNKQGRRQRILIIDDNPTNITAVGMSLSRDYEIIVATSGVQAFDTISKQLPDLILLDVVMPGMDGLQICKRIKANEKSAQIPVIFITAHDDEEKVVDCFSVGAVDYIRKPLCEVELVARISTHLTLQRQIDELAKQNQALEKLAQELKIESAERKKADAKVNTLVRHEAQKWDGSNLIGRSPAMLALHDDINRLQQIDKTSVLVLGESGSGKELVARAIHFGGPRSKKPFIAVNCSAIPRELADATFFGNVKGAYTGAVSDRKGHFVEADGGTLFLDEIGDMPLEMQAKLLRVLEDGVVTPVGGNQSKKVDVRVVCATNVNIHQKVSQQQFRQDLYFRLASYVVNVPALRDRQEDLALLVTHFIHLFSQEMGQAPVSINEEAMQILTAHHFPGNVRELKNLIEFALIRSNQQIITPAQLQIMQFQDIDVNLQHSSKTPEHTPSFVTRRKDEDVILAYLNSHDQITNMECQKLIDVNHDRASYLLRKLHKEGKIIKQGQRRWSYYCLSNHSET
ncbi:sigma-54-dependent transcriptional regulator [Pseudoalteromonas luteoviolacea]|uniref:Response regulator containing CheY-like receiver, AAA-type ATPase, and DNA-binding domain protein n=1 Tax=Pseudoalteromonas luteoviolacea (strain 2ta16) TaxID=1353533 RepID=V4HLG6_PSEL2|nr:sigma-54 dependent transcriptional regulator [Pseudoalteromonas luteoviolacea]ESP90618.1 response regulator containing CheY-like receiver, AAA-type ATPase, and DNA-binding domain protein [Pseudoalteromonas luteoviolacea 2ta16]KZN41808.1 hypothetical protein N483_14145 [Pseudoalteromonas luteoviolacea NCIMB 1944]